MNSLNIRCRMRFTANLQIYKQSGTGRVCLCVSSPSTHTVWRLLCNNFSPSSVCKFVHAPATEVGSRSADWLHMLLLQLHLATQMMQNAIPISTYRIPNGQELQLSSELAPGPVHPRGKVHVRKVVVDSIGKLHRHDEVHQRS